MKNSMKWLTFISLLVIVGCMYIVFVFTYDNSNTTQTLDPTESNEMVGEIINGIPIDMFIDTMGRTFQFTLKNNISNNVFVLSDQASLDQMFQYNFYESDSDIEANSQNNNIVGPQSTSLMVKLTENKPDNVFVFGAVNETDTELTFEDARLIYVSYRGDSEWELCGIATDMSREQVVEVLGEPTQELDTDLGRSMEWYILVEEHTYLINVLFDVEENAISKIILSIDNYPIYTDGLIITE